MLCRLKFDACVVLISLLVLISVQVPPVDSRPFSFADLFLPFQTAQPQTNGALEQQQQQDTANSYNYDDGTNGRNNYANVGAFGANNYAYGYPAVAVTGNSAAAVQQQAAQEGRLFLHVKKKKRRRRRRRKGRPCRPRDARTYPNINFVYVEVNENINCEPSSYDQQGGGGGLGSLGGGGNGGGLAGLFGSNGAGSSGAEADEEEYDDIIDEYTDPVSVNHHGPLGSPPIQTVPVQSAAVSSSTANRPSGGPLGFFGQGGLFDFAGGSGQNQNFVGVNPVHGGGGGGGGYDDVRPVIEINVPETFQDVVTWRPTTNLVGGIQNAVTGFVQQAVNRPGRTLRQLNREISSLFDPFTDLFF